jgi:hypothetical protein
MFSPKSPISYERWEDRQTCTREGEQQCSLSFCVRTLGMQVVDWIGAELGGGGHQRKPRDDYEYCGVWPNKY